MQKEEIKKLIEEIIEERLKELDDFRRWRRFDSATDQFSPITGASNQIGFFGTSKVSKQTVSGAKGGNAALTSLITALSTYGLITDSTS